MTKERQETTPARAWERKWVEKRASSALNGTPGRRRNSDLREREGKRRKETGNIIGETTHRRYPNSSLSQGNKFKPELDWSVAKGNFPYYRYVCVEIAKGCKEFVLLRKDDSRYPLITVQNVQLCLIN